MTYKWGSTGIIFLFNIEVDVALAKTSNFFQQKIVLFESNKTSKLQSQQDTQITALWSQF